MTVWSLYIERFRSTLLNNHCMLSCMGFSGFREFSYRKSVILIIKKVCCMVHCAAIAF